MNQHDWLSLRITRLFVGEIEMRRFDVFRHQHETKYVQQEFQISSRCSR